MNIKLIVSNTVKKINAKCLHTTARTNGIDHGNDPVKNFKDFLWPNEVTTFEHHKQPKHLLEKEFNYPVCRDRMEIRYPGYWFKDKFHYVPEMEPELVVPDLTGFELSPYVSYRAEDKENKPFTAKQLFNEVYRDKIIQDFKDGKIDSYEVEKEHINEARKAALKTGSDIFQDYCSTGVREKNPITEKMVQ